MLNKNKLLIKLVAVVFLFVLICYSFLVSSPQSSQSSIKNVESGNKSDFVSTVVPEEDYNVWCIFTKVQTNSLLKSKFQVMVKSLLQYNSVPVRMNIISDNASRDVAEEVLLNAMKLFNKSVAYSFYDVRYCCSLIDDIVDVLKPHFSSQPGTYYSDALFYLSIGLYRFAPLRHRRAILIDCDIKFQTDIAILFKQFDEFNENNLFGLSFELTPVYRHVLYSYRSKQNTTFGEYLHPNAIATSGNHVFGFPGFNSGVVLLNLSAIRKSKEFPRIISNETVTNLTAKYKFHGHLGDQDFYTLLAYDRPELFRTLPCGFNRQLCVWWRDHGYADVFADYSRCDSDIYVYHGNCNSPIP